MKFQKTDALTYTKKKDTNNMPDLFALRENSGINSSYLPLQNQLAFVQIQKYMYLNFRFSTYSIY